MYTYVLCLCRDWFRGLTWDKVHTKYIYLWEVLKCGCVFVSEFDCPGVAPCIDGTLKIQLLASLFFFFFLNCSNSLFVTHAIYAGRRSEQKNENEIIRLAEISKLDFLAIGKDTGLPGSRWSIQSYILTYSSRHSSGNISTVVNFSRSNIIFYTVPHFGVSKASTIFTQTGEHNLHYYVISEVLPIRLSI